MSSMLFHHQQLSGNSPATLSSLGEASRQKKQHTKTAPARSAHSHATMMAQQYHEEAVEEQQEEQGLSSGVSGNML